MKIFCFWCGKDVSELAVRIEDKYLCCDCDVERFKKQISKAK